MIESIWSKDGFIERENQKARNMIAAEEATCKELPISSCEWRDVWGIWFGLGDNRLLVDPIELVNTIYKDDIYYLLDKYVEEGEEKPEGHYKVAVSKWNSCYSWRIYHTNSEKMIQMQFTYKDYLVKIKNCINGLYDAWSSEKPVAYNKFDAELEGIDMCRKQLLVSGVTPSHYQLMTKDVIPEEFVFIPDEKHLEGYTIGIGNRSFHTWYTHWDSDMENVRQQMESFLHRKAEIILNFDTDETIIKIGHVSVLDKIEKAGNGYGYKYKGYDLIEIVPNGFVKMPIIKGYCKENEAIQKLYEGLLDIASRHPVDGKEDIYDDTPSRLVAYNRYKSPLLESFLRKDEVQSNTYKIRQIVVKDIIRIDPDYDAFLWDNEGASLGLEDLYDKEGKSIEIPEIEDWAHEMAPIVIDSETGRPYEKDWADYHKRGLALANRLRELLSPDFDLWYEAPLEDKSGTIPHRILIL